MRRVIYYLSITIILFSTIIISKEVFSQEKDDRINAFNKSIFSAKEGDYNKSLNDLLSIYDKYSNDYLINLRLGYLFYLTKNYDKSINHYKKALSILNNKSIEPLLGLTLPYAAKENWSEVKKIYLQILSIDPVNYTANLRLGQMYFNRKEYYKAEKYLQKVFELYPSDYEANLYLGWTYFYLNRKSEAKERFIYVLMISPNDQSANEGLKLVK